jgi:addiction module HigA family antidote
MKLNNVHPGEILLEEFLLPMTISQNKLARDIDVPPRRINEIVHGLRAITADTDLRLSRALGTSEGYWLGLQADYDLEEKKIGLKNTLDKIKSLVLIDNLVEPLG